MHQTDKSLVFQATLSAVFILVLAGVIFFLTQPRYLTVLGISTQLFN